MEKEEVEIEAKKSTAGNTEIKPVMDYDEGFAPEYPKKKEIVVETNEVTHVEQESKDIPSAEAGKEEEEQKTPETANDDNSFRLTMTTDLWNQITRILKPIYPSDDGVVFNLKNNGMNTIVIDLAHVAIISIGIPREAFNEYSINKETRFCLNIDSAYKFKNGSLVSISRQKNTGTIEFQIIEFRSPEEITLNIPEMDPDAVTIPKIPELHMGHGPVVVPLKPYKEYMSKVTTDWFRMTVKEGEMILTNKSETDTSLETSITTVLNKSNGLYFKDGAFEEKCSYPAEYIQSLVKALTTVKNIEINYKTDYPMEVKFSLPIWAKKVKGEYMDGIVDVTYLLAPRMVQ